MAITIDRPSRVFTLNALELPDPDPTLAPPAALALYEPNYPQLTGASLAPPEVRGDGTLVYAVTRQDLKTKG